MKNEFNISNGNLEVLKSIPEMMTKPKWRKQLRLLVFDYKFKDGSIAQYGRAETRCSTETQAEGSNPSAPSSHGIGKRILDNTMKELFTCNCDCGCKEEVDRAGTYCIICWNEHR